MSTKDRTGKDAVEKTDKKESNQAQSSNPPTDHDTVIATVEKTDGRTKTGKTDKTTKASTTKTEHGDAKDTEKTTKNSGRKTEGAETKVDEEKKKDGSGGKTDTGGAETKGSGGKESETGRGGSSDEKRKKPAAPPTPAAAPPTPPAAAAAAPPAAPSLPRPSVKTATAPSLPRPSVKTAKCPSVSTAKPIGAQSNGRKTGPLVMAKPSGPRALTKSAPSSSTTKGSSGTSKSSDKRAKSVEKPAKLTEKTAVELPAGPPAWHCGWLVAGTLIAILVVLIVTMTVFVAAKGADDAAEKAMFTESNPSPSHPNQRKVRQIMGSDRAKFRLREPPDPL